MQHTLYAMGEAALAACGDMTAITLSLPNRHHLLVDLTPFGLDNPNEIFVATDQPFGLIEATVVCTREHHGAPGSRRAMTILVGTRLQLSLHEYHGRSLDDVHRRSVSEPVPAVVGAADRIGVEHPPRLRSGLGRRGDQDDRPASGRQRAGPEDQVSARRRGFGAPLDEEAPRRGAALIVELGAHLRQDARLVGAAARPDQEGVSEPVLVASIMAGSGNDTELRHWQELAVACQEQGCDALELNLSCPHMDRPDMGSNVGKDKELVSIVTKVVKEVARIPVWAKLTPSTTDIVVEARGAFLGGADAIVVVEHLHVAAAHRR